MWQGYAALANVSTYVVHDDGTLTPVATATDGQGALCWIARDGRPHRGGPWHVLTAAAYGRLEAIKLLLHPYVAGLMPTG